MGQDDAPGWFGKLAALGDFASRRLAPDWIQACDQWLSECVEASRKQLGERWLSVYLSAPVWRFAWGPGIVDARWWFGVLMPSCDSVGRYFPLVVAHPRAQPPSDRIALDHLELWWQYLAHAALQTLGEGGSLDGFETSLREAPPWPRSRRLTVLEQEEAGAGREHHCVAAGVSLGDLAHSLAATGFIHRLAGTSAWMPLRSASEPASVTLQAGLPLPAAFAEMLAGNW
jgi:type VI secretion system protein ImpM